MLYRLCGDRNPLHADPEFAKAAGFPAPILHGLCSYGIVLRTVTDELFGGDTGKVRSFNARFAGVVFPGETIRVRGWQTDEGSGRHRHGRGCGRPRRRARAGRLRADARLALEQAVISKSLYDILVPDPPPFRRTDERRSRDPGTGVSPGLRPAAEAA